MLTCTDISVLEPEGAKLSVIEDAGKPNAEATEKVRAACIVALKEDTLPDRSTELSTLTALPPLLTVLGATGKDSTTTVEP